MKVTQRSKGRKLPHNAAISIAPRKAKFKRVRHALPTPDITERKRTEKNASHLVAIVESSDDAISSTTMEGIITSWNKGAEMIYGYPAQEMVGKSASILKLPNQPDELTQMLERVKKAERIEDYETKRVRKDGETIDVSITVSPIKDSTGRIVGASAVARDITERKQMEEGLRKSEAMYRRLFETSQEGIAILDADTEKIIDANPFLQRLSGLSLDQLQGKSLSEIESFKEVRRQIDFEELRKREFIRIEPVSIKIKEKGSIDVELFSIIYEAGDRKVVQCSIRDVTERIRLQKQLERHVKHLDELVHERTMKLRKSEDGAHRLAEELTALDTTVLSITETADLASLLRTIVERAVKLLEVDGGGLHLTDPERQEIRRVVFYNLPIEAVNPVLKYGEGAAGTVAKTGQPLIINSYRTWPGRAAAYEHVKQSRAILSVPLIWHGEVTGVINVVSYKEARLFNQDDLNLLSRFASHAAIVVQRKKLEERLRESEEKFRRIAEESFDPILTFNRQLQVTYASPAWFLMTGYAPEQVIGKYFTVFLPEEEREKRVEAFNRVLAGEVVRAQETELLMADGSLAHVEVTLSPISESDGRVIGVESILRDTTERNRLAKMRDQFVSAVTHELRTPLVSIQGYLDLILSESGIVGQTKEDLMVMKRNTKMLGQLVDDLLDIQRLASGRMPLDLQPLNLQTLINDSIQQVQPLTKKNHDFQLEMPDSELTVVGDKIRLSQVVMNMLQNAIKFTPNHGRIIVRVKDEENNLTIQVVDAIVSNAVKFSPQGGEIIIRASEEADMIRVQIIDLGIGIKQEDLERIFDLFPAIHISSYVKGKGLGLRTAKGLVEAHGGRIWAESPGEGKGATFTFTLPKRKELG